MPSFEKLYHYDCRKCGFVTASKQEPLPGVGLYCTRCANKLTQTYITKHLSSDSAWRDRQKRLYNKIRGLTEKLKRRDLKISRTSETVSALQETVRTLKEEIKQLSVVDYFDYEEFARLQDQLVQRDYEIHLSSPKLPSLDQSQYVIKHEGQSYMIDLVYDKPLVECVPQ